MAKTDFSELTNLLLDPKQHWVSGIYEFCKSPAVIVVSAEAELWSADLYVYSYFGLEPSYFIKYERLIWPVGSDEVFSYQLADETNLCLHERILFSDLSDKDDYDITVCDAMTATAILCPRLRRLNLLSNSAQTLEELLDDDIESFNSEFPGLVNLQTIDFWGSAGRGNK